MIDRIILSDVFLRMRHLVENESQPAEKFLPKSNVFLNFDNAKTRASIILETLLSGCPEFDKLWKELWQKKGTRNRSYVELICFVDQSVAKKPHYSLCVNHELQFMLLNEQDCEVGIDFTPRQIRAQIFHFLNGWDLPEKVFLIFLRLAQKA